MKSKLLPLLGLSLLSATAYGASVTTYSDNVTSNVIFGTGNSNGNFTVVRDADLNLEIGLRAKVPFVGGIKDNGNGRYGTYNDPWNFDFSVNTAYNGGTAKVGSYTYRLSLDSNPAVGNVAPGDFLSFDPITPSPPSVPFFDHSFGINTTTSLNDSRTTSDAFAYAGYLNANNLVQNSWRYAFFDSFAPLTAYTGAPGEYEVRLEVIDGVNGVIGTNSIFVMIPEPTLALGGLLCIAGLGIRRRSR
jgi:hypothetical protein